MTSNKTKIFIDGQHGTTGLQILDRLKDRADIELLELPMADRKDLGKRAEIARASDITVLCLPDAAAKELVAAMGNSDTVVIDASTAHRVADGWTYGFPSWPRTSARSCSTPTASATRAAIRPAPSRCCGRWSMPGSCGPIPRRPCLASRATPAAARN